MTKRSLAHPAAPAAAAFQTTQPPTDAAGILADLASLRTVIAEATRRYTVALRSEQDGPADAEPAHFRSPRCIYEHAAPDMAGLDHEELRVLLLNSKNALLDTVELYRGTLKESTVRIGELFKAAIVANAASVVLVHNHPSGDPTPSPEDVRVTTEAVKAGKLLDIEVLDHVIIGRRGGSSGAYVSLKERGLGW